MNYQQSQKFSTPKIPLREKSSREAQPFVDFLAAIRVKASPRGDLIAMLRTLANADALPPITSWRDLFRLMTARGACPADVETARKLWREYTRYREDAANQGDVPSPQSRGLSP